MKPSILVVILDFLVCSLLLFVIGTGGKQTRFATSAPPTPAMHEEFSSTAMQAQQEEWNRDYEQQTLLNQLHVQATENQQLRSRLTETSATLAAREANLKAVSEEKARVEQAKSQTEQALSSVETQLTRVNTERQKLQQEGEAAKESLSKLQTELTGLQSQQAKLQQERTELAEHAQQLGQTVASQQATINTLSEQVQTSQARTEAQLTDIARGQEQMGSTLQQLNEFTHALPVALQKSVAGVHEDQQTMQQNLAALAENMKDLQAQLDPEEQARLMQAVSDVAKGQKQIQTRLDDLISSGQTNGIGQSLNTIEAGQDALRQQTAKLADQIESIKARGPGPFKAVKGARMQLLVALAKRDEGSLTTMRFKAAAYPPVVNAGGRTFIVASDQTLGLTWWALTDEDTRNRLAELKYTARRSGDAGPSIALTTPACVLSANPHVVSIELDHPVEGLTTMELAGPDAGLQTDQRKLYVFKSTAAGLSFETDASPDLANGNYLVIKRPMRGIAAWFENPAYRAEAGDYIVTADGKLVGIMIDREKCFVLNKDNVQTCAMSVPLTNSQQFQHAVAEFQHLR
jgi:predicted  nucleic acid-binding Zn-ribbon protein